MKVTNKTTVSEVIQMLHLNDFMDKLIEKYQPVDLPEITYGQRIDLCSMANYQDLLFVPQRMFFHRGEKTVLNMPFFEVFNFGMSIQQELERMHVRDKNTFKHSPTPEEIKAGYYNINHGIFGIVDKIALRLGLSNHEDVFKLPEKRVYAMLKIDYDNGMYQRRLNKVKK